MTQPNRLSVFLFAVLCIFSNVRISIAETLTPKKAEAKAPEISGGFFLSHLGTRGLINIPTPAINGKERVIAGFKSTQAQSYSYFVKTTEFNETLRENRFQLAIPFNPDSELILNQVKISKNVSSAGITTSENHDLISLGGKFTGTLEEKGDFCLGFQWVSGDTNGLRQADLETISTTRNAYVTFGAKMNSTLSGFLHLKQCFTPEFKSLLSDGSEVVIGSKSFTSSGIGFEKFFGHKNEASAVIEVNYSDYQSISPAIQREMQINAGLRFKVGPAGIEINARSLTGSPAITTGISFAL